MAKVEKLYQMFADHVQSSGALEEIKKTSLELDSQIEESHRFLKEIRIKFNAISQTEVDNEACNDITRHEDISRFLEADSPRLLLPDMEDVYNIDLDIDQSINKFKSIIEEIKKSDLFALTPVHHPKYYIDSKALDKQVSDYKVSLEKCCKQLVRMKSVKNNPESFQRNMELEEKLQCLIEDVKSFSKMIEAKTLVSECNEKWSSVESSELKYSEIIKDMLNQINQVMINLLDYQKTISRIPSLI